VTLRDDIQERFSSMTRGQKELIQRILDDYEKFVFLSINKAANELGVYKSALVRLAQSLGYHGYADFRSELQDLYRQEVSPGKKLGKTLSEVDDENLFLQVVETERLYLQEALKTVRQEDIRRAAKIISDGERIFVCSRSPQGVLAEELEFRLRRFHFDVVSVSEEGRPILEKVQLLRRGDVLVLYSFVGMPKEHRMAIELANEMECPIIMITDTVANDMAIRATVTLTARRGPATLYHTNIVPQAIQTALVLQIAKLRSPGVLEDLDRLQRLRDRFGFDSSFVRHAPP